MRKKTTAIPPEENIEYLETIISLMPGHVYWKDRNGLFLGCNDEQAKYIGLQSRHDVIGLTAHDTLPKKFADQITKTDNEILETGISKTTEEILELPNGETSIWLSKKVPLYNKSKKIIGILGISIDITEKKKIEQELREVRQTLEGMTLVSAAVAHELRTPLSTLAASTSNIKSVFPALKEAYLWARGKQAPIKEISDGYLDGLEKTIASMRKEVEAAFTFIDMTLIKTNPSLEGGKPEVLSINDIIEFALDRYPFTADQRNLIRWQPDTKNNFDLVGDKVLITHVLFNLIKNSLHYVAKAGKGHIEITIEKNTSFNKMYFKDTGTGIASGDIPFIFDNFFTKTDRSAHPAGIGLTFCKAVMTSLKGGIDCESTEGEYTLFTLRFPSKMDTFIATQLL